MTLALRSLPVAIWLLAGALFAVPPAWAQTTAPVFPPASKVGLIPPPDFVLSRNFVGFQHNEKQASILVGELPSYAFEALEKEVAAGMANDPNAATREEIELADGGKGFILFARPGSPQGTVLKWTMAARVKNTTAIVTAVIPESVHDVAPDEAIRAALKSVTVRAEVPVEEQLSVLPFTMTDLAGFRIVRVQPGGAAMLTDGPSDVIELAQQPLFLISVVPGPPPATADRDVYARRLIGDIPGIREVKIQRSEPLRLIRQQGYETVVDAKDVKGGGDLGAVQWLRFGTGAVIRLVGIAPKGDWDKTFQRFRALRDSVELK
jgi:hypothetical protein